MYTSDMRILLGKLPYAFYCVFGFSIISLLSYFMGGSEARKKKCIDIKLIDKKVKLLGQKKRTSFLADLSERKRVYERISP